MTGNCSELYTPSRAVRGWLSWAVIPSYVRLPCTMQPARHVMDMPAVGVIFKSSLCTSPLSTDCPVLVTGHCLCVPPGRSCVSGDGLAELPGWVQGLSEEGSQKHRAPWASVPEALWDSSHKKHRCGCTSPALCHPSLAVAIPVQGS